MIINFTVHLIISKLLRRQKSRQKDEKKYVEAKDEIVYKNVFIRLNT